jgi:hypothetical protein
MAKSTRSCGRQYGLQNRSYPVRVRGACHSHSIQAELLRRAVGFVRNFTAVRSTKSGGWIIYSSDGKWGAVWLITRREWVRFPPLQLCCEAAHRSVVQQHDASLIRRKWWGSTTRSDFLSRAQRIGRPYTRFLIGEVPVQLRVSPVFYPTLRLGRAAEAPVL